MHFGCFNHNANGLNHHYPSGGVVVVQILYLLQLAAGQAGDMFTPPPAKNPFMLGSQFNPTMAIIMVILVAAFFFLGFFSIYVRRCTGGRRYFGDDFHFDHFAGSRWSISDPPGLDQEIIDSFPTFLYSSVKDLKIGKGGVECAVCLCEFEDDETLRLIPKCSHVFHPKCIDAWLVSHVTCPVCRANLVLLAPPPDRYSFLSFPDHQLPAEPADHVVVGRAEDHHPSDPLPQADQDQNNIIHDDDDVVLTLEEVVVRPHKKQSHSRTGSNGWNTFKQLFPRSHSTGHSLVQSGENLERFTLRLSEDVRNRLLSTELNRTRSCVVFTRARSGRRGFRSEGGGGSSRPSKSISSSGTNHRFDLDHQEDRTIRKGSASALGLPPLPPKTSSGFGSSSSRSAGKKLGTATGGSEDTSGSLPRRSSRSVKSSFDRFLLGLDTNYTSNANQKPIGERSFDRLRGDDQV